MLCPKCGNPLQEMWREEWQIDKDHVGISGVAHCENCDYDCSYDIDENGNEVNVNQYFFG